MACYTSGASGGNLRCKFTKEEVGQTASAIARTPETSNENPAMSGPPSTRKVGGFCMSNLRLDNWEKCSVQVPRILHVAARAAARRSPKTPSVNRSRAAVRHGTGDIVEFCKAKLRVGPPQVVADRHLNNRRDDRSVRSERTVRDPAQARNAGRLRRARLQPFHLRVGRLERQELDGEFDPGSG
jgi:hypothetical protein